MKKALSITLIPVLFISSCFIFYKKDEIKIDHIFLITVDTLRADHLGCYGYIRNTSPFIDSLAENGVLFTRAYSQSASTCPSHASIFTGFYPLQHRVLANHFILDNSYTTLAEILKKNGYKTSAFTSTDRHFHESNINQGFEFYEEPVDTKKTYGFKYRPARLTINNAIVWLDNFNPKNKLFLWIHVFDPHFPYHPPEKYYKEIDNNLKNEMFLKYLEMFHINIEAFSRKILNPNYEHLNNRKKMYEYITNYDAEIRYADEELKRFYNFAERKGLNKNSLWILTSDHGEGLGQHNWLGHSAMIYQEEIHVPLIFFSEQKFKSKRIEDVIENFDIFSTVLDILKIKLDEKLKKEVKSISLLKKIWSTQENLDKNFAFSERERRTRENDVIKVWDEKEKYSIQDENFKYIYRSDFEDEFYNLKEDPLEQNNLINSSTDKYIEEKKTMKEKLLRILNKLKKHRNLKTKIVDKETIEKLKSLGYIK